MLTHNDAKMTQGVLLQLGGSLYLASVCGDRAKLNLTQYDAKPCNRLHDNEQRERKVTATPLGRYEKDGEKGGIQGNILKCRPVLQPSHIHDIWWSPLFLAPAFF